MKPPVLIQDQESLEKLIPELAKQERIGIDTESNSLYAYSEQVCLIQISTPTEDYLVDPLKISDPSPLAAVLEDSSVEKILHGAEYDVICLRRDFSFQINNLFDTRVALRTLGRQKTGLADILKNEFGARVNKRFQRANWGKRPLPDEQLHYARMDTHYLIPLRDKLAEELRESGRWGEAYEENQRLTHIPMPDNGFDPDGFWGISHSHKLSGRGRAILRELYLMRDRFARSMDRPPFKVLGNKTLLEISNQAPRSMRDLEPLHGMTSGQIRRYGDEILKAVQRGINAKPPSKPRHPRADDAVVARNKCLLEWRKQRARSRKVESDVVLSRDIVWEIASTDPQNLKQLEEIMKDLPRRFSMYGQDIINRLQTCPKAGRKRKR